MRPAPAGRRILDLNMKLKFSGFLAALISLAAHADLTPMSTIIGAQDGQHITRPKCAPGSVPQASVVPDQPNAAPDSLRAISYNLSVDDDGWRVSVVATDIKGAKQHLKSYGVVVNTMCAS